MIWTFYKALFKNPRAVGAVFPSSKYLANTIAKLVPVETEGVVIDLGAGTGVITRALLQRGIAHHQIIAVEASSDLVVDLRTQFPQIQVLQGNANHLSTLLADLKTPIKTVVSSIPLKILSHDAQDRIIKEIESVLMPGGYYIQYTYWVTRRNIEDTSRFKKIATRKVWLNVPPAHVDVFQNTKNY